MRPKGSADLISDRRRRAMDLLDSGLSLNEVGRRIGCEPSSVMRWRDRREADGEAAFDVGSSTGRPTRLRTAQLRKLEKTLLKGALACGYRTDLWTTSRIAEVIARIYGVTYHPDHIGRLLGKMGWSHQKPEKRALERDEEAIQRWKEREWPRVKKTPGGWAPT